MDKEDCVWTGSEDGSDFEKGQSCIEKEIRKVRQKAKENSDLIDADDSDELVSYIVCGLEVMRRRICGLAVKAMMMTIYQENPIQMKLVINILIKLFKFVEKPKYRTISELLNAENEPEELSPGKQARKLAVENALKKLKKGPDGHYTNVWEVMSDTDILIGAFENIVSGPEYEELRKGGPKK